MADQRTKRTRRRLQLKYPCCNGQAYFNLFRALPQHRFDRRCPGCGRVYEVDIRTTVKPKYIVDIIDWDW